MAVAQGQQGWRPSVQLCAQGHFPVDRLELWHDQRHPAPARPVRADIAEVPPATERLLRRMDLHDAWNFQNVCGALLCFGKNCSFDENRERHDVHLPTGMQVAQICWFLLTEPRHVPARVVRTGPPRGMRANSARSASSA